MSADIAWIPVGFPCAGPAAINTALEGGMNIPTKLKGTAMWARNNPGKVILGVAGVAVGAAVGGIGIAVAGTAFGVPAAGTALGFGTAGTLVGREIDRRNQ